MEQQNKSTGKLTDKAFSRLAFISFFAIFICIVCLCSTTFAWFTDSSESKSNEINIATDCLITVSVASSDGTLLDGIEDGAELSADEEYTVTVSLPANTASGYCIIHVGDNSYYSEYIVRHEDPEAHTVTFTLKVGTAQTVTFESHWGIYARESDVLNGGELLIP